jgi:hypothetical protein
MVRAIVNHVAASAKAFEIAEPVVARVVIKRCRGENHPRLAYLHGFLEIRPLGGPSAVVSPGLAHGIEPAAILIGMATRVSIDPSLTD